MRKRFGFTSALILICLLICTSCSDRINVNKEKELLLSIVGREIVLPDDLIYRIQDTPIDYDMAKSDFRVIAYISSDECTPCQMRLQAWNKLINEFKSLKDVDVDFLMIINSNEDEKVNLNLKLDMFMHPICLDSEGIYGRLNTLPEGDIYNTVLLDADNKVVCVGNPVLSPKIKAVYLQAMTGKKASMENDSSEKETIVSALGIVHPGDSIFQRFTILNNDIESHTIQDIIPSCGCIRTSISKTKIEPGGYADLLVVFEPDSEPGYFSRYVDIFYIEKNNPERVVLHGYNSNKSTNH